MVAERLKSVKKWTKKIKSELGDNYIGYFNNTTVHGLKYLTEPRRPWPEKVLWFVGVSVSLVACLWLMHKTIMRWRDSPVIIVMDDSHRTIWQIPFPAVTICPQAKARTEYLNYTDLAKRYKARNVTGITEEQVNELAVAQIPCRIPSIVGSDASNDKNGTEIIERISLSKKDVFETTNMNPFVDDPEFQPILTKEGVCFSFNMMPKKYMFRQGSFHASKDYLEYHYGKHYMKVNWDPTTGYEKDIDLMEAYPRPALGVGEETGLYMSLKTKFKYLHSMCNSLGHGFQVILHSPIEFPQLRHETIFVPLDSFVEIYLTPQEIRTSEDLRGSYNPQQRQCFFHDERYLKFFNYYTQKNCELECLANATLSKCKCVEFYMPRDQETPVCGNERCSKEVAGHMYLNSSKSKQAKYCNSCSKPQSIRPPCNCLQSCAHIRYQSHHVKSNLDPGTTNDLLHSKMNHREDDMNRSHVYIFYKDSLFIPIRREEVFGTSDLLGSLGGLMGLCIGVSLLSVIEFFYWLCCRPCCQRIKQSNPQLRSIRKNLQVQKTEAAVQYSRYLEDEAGKQQQQMS